MCDYKISRVNVTNKYYQLEEFYKVRGCGVTSSTYVRKKMEAGVL
jgi:hypothetical protein